MCEELLGEGTRVTGINDLGTKIVTSRSRPLGRSLWQMYDSAEAA